jgi:antitoxin CcdA
MAEGLAQNQRSFRRQVDTLVKCFIMRIMVRITASAINRTRGNHMQSLYDSNAPKKPTNLSLNSDLLAKIRVLNINLSATLEHALKHELAQAEASKWAETNKTAIRAYNNFVEENGCFGDEFRTF